MMDAPVMAVHANLNRLSPSTTENKLRSRIGCLPCNDDGVVREGAVQYYMAHPLSAVCCY